MFVFDEVVVTILEPGPEQGSSLVQLKSDTAGAANMEINLSDLHIVTKQKPLGKEICVASNVI